MVLASDIILESLVCRQASRNIYPQDPDELFNHCWLAIRERELKQPGWIPDNVKHYFLRSMRNEALRWKQRELKPTKEIELNEWKPFTPQQEQFFFDWIDETTFDEDLLFLKNILTLALYCTSLNEACEAAEMSRMSFLKYRKIAQQRVYDDYRIANPYDLPDDIVV